MFNGEIYNYKNQRKVFRNEELNSNSDTEILLLLYEKLGEKCLDYLKGMFAFCNMGSIKRRIVSGARQRPGKNRFIILVKMVYSRFV